MGLGLSIVMTMVLAHGGQVYVVDTPISGTRFEVVFPGI